MTPFRTEKKDPVPSRITAHRRVEKSITTATKNPPAPCCRARFFRSEKIPRYRAERFISFALKSRIVVMRKNLWLRAEKRQISLATKNLTPYCKATLLRSAERRYSVGKAALLRSAKRRSSARQSDAPPPAERLKFARQSGAGSR